MNSDVRDTISRFRAMKAGSTSASSDKEKAQYRGYSTVDKFKPSFFNGNTGRDVDRLKKYELIYCAGGIASQGIDAYPYYILANGYKIIGEDKDLVEEVEERLDAMDLLTIMECGIKDACKFGSPYQEIAYGRGSMSDTPVDVIPLPAWQFRNNFDARGRTISYTQTVPLDGMKQREIDFPLNNIINYPLFPSTGNPYGVGLIERCLSAILNDDKVSEATAMAILRHGFPKYHIKIGQEGEEIDPDTLRGFDTEFRSLESKNEIATSHDVEIVNLDKDALPNIKDIMEINTTRLCVSLGVPEVVMGLGRGATEASSKTEMEAFFKRIHMLQKKVARIYNYQLIDKITKKPGAVKIEFNDANPQEEKEIVDMLYKLATATPLDPTYFVSKGYFQKRLGYDPKVYLDSAHEYDSSYDDVKDEYYKAINDKRDTLPNSKDKASIANQPKKKGEESKDDVQ